MEGLIMAAQLILGLSILVGLHELGHLLAAKAFGMRVEKYSIGFPPKIFSFKKGETEYSLGAIPLGGFVKITGMIDESLDTKSLSAEPKPWEFRSKPAWQRLIVMLGGIIANVITGIIIFIFLAKINGDTYLSKEQLNENGIVASELAQEIGLKTGDKIVKVNGQDYNRFTDLLDPNVILGSNSFYTVLRDGQELNVSIPSNLLDKLSDDQGPFLQPFHTFKIGQVAEGSPAYEAGILAGDRIEAINGEEVKYYHEAVDIIQSSSNKELSFRIRRPSDEVEQIFEELQVTARISSEGKLGFIPTWTTDLQYDSYSWGEAASIGTYDAFNFVWINIKAFGKIFSGEVSARKSLSGPIGIAQIFGGSWDWLHFWRITALLSMILAFMNFLPIPALDGGHVAFLLYELVSGRKPSDKFLENSQKVGMVILLSIMVFAFYNDIARFFLQ